MNPRHEFDSDSEYKEYLRTYFAAMAMQGLLSTNVDVSIEHVLTVLELPKETTYIFKEHFPKYTAILSAMYADSLLTELEKPTP